MELFFETTESAGSGIATSEGPAGALARIRESAPDEGGIRSPFLLAGSRDGLAQLPRLLAMATDTALTVRRLAGPLPAGKTADVYGAVAAALGPVEVPLEGIGAEAALRRLAQVLVEYGLDLSHPRAAAHLQPPPLSVAVAADALASITNASLDTYDSGPSAIAVERWLIGVLVKMAGLGPCADGVLTPGGSLSNLLGLLLARDAAGLRLKVDARREGVAAMTGPVVLCSELAHFSVHRACAALGLGENAVRAVPTDERRRMRPGALDKILRGLGDRHTPVAIVATAGTTDFGSIDCLPEIADVAAEHGVWLHVDAAYGFGALFSDRLAGRLAGIERADSITLDLHKIGWQPAAASVLLVADKASFAALDREVAYLNPSDDAEAGLDGLLGRSLQTTRRPDAVKIVATLLAHGRRGMGDMVDACHDLARYAEHRILKEPELELVSPAELTTVVFRYRSRTRPAGWDAGVEDEINGALRRRLLERGIALIGRTAVRLDGADGRESVCLKFTLLNPTAKPGDIDDLVHAVLRAGRDAARHIEERLV
jgi:glutamate/tyrosine decarboxylase-like PLP-dependent enzyme